MIKEYKPTSPGRRFGSVVDYSTLDKVPACRKLLSPLHKSGGRNARGRMCMHHKGGGEKRQYRIVDFKRCKDGIPATVKTLEYDPNRSAFIAFITYADGERSYILAPEGVVPGDTVISGEEVPLKPGNTMPLKNIPVGLEVHNIEFLPRKGGQMARSAGSYAQLQAKEGDVAHICLPSGEVRVVKLECRATIGHVSNKEHNTIVIGKAGRKRHMGIRPTVRGVAMNPVSHPMGGGEARSKGNRHPVSPWGQQSKGLKTRGKRNISETLIIRHRKKRRKRK